MWLMKLIGILVNDRKQKLINVDSFSEDQLINQSTNHLSTNSDA